VTGGAKRSRKECYGQWFEKPLVSPQIEWPGTCTEQAAQIGIVELSTCGSPRGKVLGQAARAPDTRRKPGNHHHFFASFRMIRGFFSGS